LVLAGTSIETGSQIYRADRRPNALGGEQRGIIVGIAEEDGELLAAEAADQIAPPDARLQHRGKLLQRRVAGVVAEAIVDALEMINIDDEQRAARGGG
jgi:hypothetical protein